MGDLKGKMAARNAAAEEKSGISAVKIAKGKTNKIGEKDKLISAKVNSDTYEQFTMINKSMGMSNNSCLNQLISKYDFDNKQYLE